MLSFLPRLPFVAALTAWAVSRAIMGCPRHLDEVAWLLRWNPHDAQQTGAAVIAQADRLLALEHPMATEAARWLFEALATPEAAVRAEPLPRPEQLSWPSGPDTVRVDRRTGSVTWDHHKALEWPRSKTTPLDAMTGLGPLAVDPSLVLPEASIAILRKLAAATSPERLWLHRDATSDDVSLEIGREALARWAPDALCGLIRRTFATAEARSLEGVWRLALALPDYLLILAEEQRRALVTAADAIDGGDDRDSELGRTAWMYIRPVRLTERPAAVAENDWHFTEGMNREEAAYGSLLLCEASTDETVDAIRERIDPQALGRLALKRRDREKDLDAFAGYVRDQLSESLQGGTPRSLSHYWADNEDALHLLVERRGEAVVEWVAPVVDDPHDAQRRLLFLHGVPLTGLCLALLRHCPDDGAKLWLALSDIYERGIVRDDRFKILPIEAPDDPVVNPLRNRVLENAKTDLDLTHIAEAVVEHERQDWLLRCIERVIGGSSADQIARGLTVAGLLHRSPAADGLWEGRLAAPPAPPGWLSDVHAWARKLYLRNSWAHHWFEGFASDRDRDRALGSFRLFLACADYRARAWAPERLSVLAESLPRAWYVHWSLCKPALRSRIQKVEDRRRKTLYGTKIFERTQAPWL